MTFANAPAIFLSSRHQFRSHLSYWGSIFENVDKKLSSNAMSVLTVRSTGPAMLVTKLAKQALRPKRIASLALPLATLGGPVTAGVRTLNSRCIYFMIE